MCSIIFSTTGEFDLTGEHLINYLENPDQLVLINYEELRTLTLAYPYAHNLRYLLALKARLEDKPEYPKLLAAAAAYSLDRRRLMALVNVPVVAPLPVAQAKEEVLELKPLTDLLQKLDLQKQELQTAAPVAQVETARLPEADNPSPPRCYYRAQDAQTYRRSLRRLACQLCSGIADRYKQIARPKPCDRCAAVGYDYKSSKPLSQVPNAQSRAQISRPAVGRTERHAQRSGGKRDIGRIARPTRPH